MKIVPLNEKLLDETFELIKGSVEPSVMDKDKSPVTDRRRGFFAKDGAPPEIRRVITAIEYAVIYHTAWVRWENAAERQYTSLPDLPDPSFSLKKAYYNKYRESADDQYKHLSAEYAICRAFLTKSGSV